MYIAYNIVYCMCILVDYGAVSARGDVVFVLCLVDGQRLS